MSAFGKNIRVQWHRLRGTVDNEWALLYHTVCSDNATIPPTHSRFTALCLGLPGLVGTRSDIHPLTSETWCESVIILDGVGKIIEASALTICWTPPHPMPPPPSFLQFYAECHSCRNPPNLSWLGIGTKYARFHNWRLVFLHNTKEQLHPTYFSLTV